MLDIPERVPFRLTQNILDGFGITGAEGKSECIHAPLLLTAHQGSSALHVRSLWACCARIKTR
jgi:phosphatidylinositol kinase/protein kinase (PI-3  family)